MLYVFTDEVGANTMLGAWLEDVEQPCVVEYYDDGSWTARQPMLVLQLGYTAVLADVVTNELRYAPRG